MQQHNSNITIEWVTDLNIGSNNIIIELNIKLNAIECINNYTL